MKHRYTITATEMRSINRAAILEIIRRESPISRTLIAEKLDVSLPTVMRIVDELIEEELVRDHGSKEWSGGRRRSLLEFNSEGHVVIGIDLGGSRLFGAIADLGGTILHEIEISRKGTTGEQSFERVVELIETLLAFPELDGRRIRGIGVGVPGITLHLSGIVTWAPSFNWRNYPLREKLSERFSLPIMVDNDVNLAALGEIWFGAGQNVQNLVLITVGAGIGAGIIIDGTLYRGSHEAAGEVGYLMPGRQFLGKRYEGFGALEELASGTGITQRARELLKDDRTPSELVQLVTEDVYNAARRGEPWARTVIDEALDYLAIMIASTSSYLDPELIVLGGEAAYYADLLIEPINQRIVGTTPVPLQLVASTLGHRATVLGAITNVLHNTTNFYVVRKLS
jgi:predicted NBD/HSP70 family sugar kinase